MKGCARTTFISRIPRIRWTAFVFRHAVMLIGHRDERVTSGDVIRSWRGAVLPRNGASLSLGRCCGRRDSSDKDTPILYPLSPLPSHYVEYFWML